MISALEKAILVLDISPIEELNQDEYRRLADNIAVAINYQDRDTRHACAEAVIECDGEMDADIKLICAGDAYSACMNVKVVL